MNYRILSVSLLAFVCAAAYGQNLDPTVVVSRDYEGKLMEVHKPKLEMAVPDSVLRFDLDFDYSVSDSPYKGAYDFTPYLLDMKPLPVERKVGKFYLNAGAGYQLHPELDLVWSPDLKSKSFRMNVFARNRSFVGQYWDIESSGGAPGLVFDRGTSDSVWKGTDMSNTAGVDGRLDWKKGILGFALVYDGLIQQEKRLQGVSRSFNAVDASLSLRSKDNRDARFGYLADVDYRYGSDALTLPSEARLNESVLGVDASLFARVAKHDRIRLDIGYDMAGYDGFFDSAASLVSVAPHYTRQKGNWDIDLGVKLAKVFRAKEMSQMYQNRIQSIYPDVKIGFKGIPSLYLYLEAGGGPTLETYSSLLKCDRHMNMFYGNGMAPLLDVTDQSVYASAGIDGRITTRFSYALKGGYSRYKLAPMSSVSYDTDYMRHVPGISYVPYSKVFAAFECRLATERVDMDLSAEYAHHLGEYNVGVLLPAALTGNASFRYNWMRRIYAGVSCEAATARRGTLTYLHGEGDFDMPDSFPGYVDLGVDLEYVVNRRISVWAKGRNLMGMTIQRSIFYAEKGPYFTLGFCLNI